MTSPNSHADPASSVSLLIQILGGVAIATKAPGSDVEKSEEWFRQVATKNGISDSLDKEAKNLSTANFEFWLRALSERPPADDVPSGLATLTIAVATLREHSRHDIPIEKAKLDILWDNIYKVLNIQALQGKWTPSRSAQGFLAVPLCSITQNGKINELIRLHVWLPDGKRGNREFSVHSHQPFAQSWILAGAGTDHQYEAQRVDDAESATHVEFGLSWNAGKGLSKEYSTHQQSSVVAPTGRLVRIGAAESALHQRNDTYTIPAGAFHSSEISPDILHATLFYFDSSRGFIQDAPVLGPVDAEPFTQVRDPAGKTPETLASYVNLLRSWETYMEEGRQHASKAEWEHAMRVFNSALSLCDSFDEVLNVKRHRGLALGELGNTNRRLGRYVASEEFLRQACLALEGLPEYATFYGELGVVYRHMDRLEDARDAFELQYATARHLNLNWEACRAIGNLGMANYQLGERSESDELFTLAIDQLQERVSRCNDIRNSILTSKKKPAVQKLRMLDVWAAVGLGRLSLCYTSRKNLEEASGAALRALEYAKNTGDPTVIAISRFFHGRVLATRDQHEEALLEFNTNEGCTPAIAFCKEPSKEHVGYLGFLAEAGADMSLVDNQGYKALDYAVFNGDDSCRDCVLNGLRSQFSTEPNVDKLLQQGLREAKLRKGYRDLFQQKLRPVLLAGGDDCISRLRVAYADALAADKGKAEMFDYFKVVPYTELRSLGRLPRSSDGLFRKFTSSGEVESRQFVILFSYRWLNPIEHSGDGRPDDEGHTQYKRMLQAVDDLLAIHKDLCPEHILVWIVGKSIVMQNN